MARIVEKVKEKVRSGSIRRSTSLGRRSDGRKSEDITSPPRPPRPDGPGLFDDSPTDDSFTSHDQTPRISQNIPAWHVHKTSGHPASNGSSPPRVITLEAFRSTEVDPAVQPNEIISQGVPSRTSSLRPKTAASTTARKQPYLARIDSESLPGLGQPQTATQLKTQASDGESWRLPEQNHGEKDLSDLTQRLALTADGRPVTQSPYDGVTALRPTTTATRTAPASQPQNIVLPDKFDLSYSERTIVDTVWRPAVTHEVIRPERTEIIQEQITRDIHVHHYYVYQQPIRVVEVLPAKHYYLDLATGIKHEIQAPEGWTMPENLKPRTPDTSMIVGSTRHYLVNEEFPQGIPEPAPVDELPHPDGPRIHHTENGTELA